MEDKRNVSNNSDALMKKVISLKEKIYTLLDDDSTPFTSSEIIKTSQELDIVINLVMKNKLEPEK